MQRTTLNETKHYCFRYTRILGVFNFRQPLLVIRDPETIKQVIVKDFDHFEDHSHVLDDKVIERSPFEISVLTLKIMYCLG